MENRHVAESNREQARAEFEDFRTAADGLSAKDLVALSIRRFGDRVALASSMGVEDQVLTHMLCACSPSPRVFTLDTGRLPEETYDTISATNERFGIRVKILFPDRVDVERMVNEEGPNLFRRNVGFRKRCCRVRKVAPLRRELSTLSAWITGLRREQAVTRTDVAPVSWDEGNLLVKICPLAEWSTDQVWEYARAHAVPVNALHEKGYPSIGCAPCTRPAGADEDLRAGRWWWETPEHRECGLHQGGRQRTAD